MTGTSSITVIAEAGVNHTGDMALARRMIETAAEAGADFVKFQSFRADRLASRDAAKAAYQIVTTGADESQYEMLRRLELSDDGHRELLAHCRACGIRFLSTPFDEERAVFLAGLGVDRLKLPSGEVTNVPFLEHVGALGLPVILSTGMSDLKEVGSADAALERAGCADITLLHCLTDYPADPAEANLRAMAAMRDAFRRPVGYSDHTPGVAVSLAAAALGASVIEKHFTLDRTLPGPDHAASLEPDELKRWVAEIRIVESALGDGVKRPAPSELANRDIARKSLVAAVDIAAGETFSRANVAAKRPGTGMAPATLAAILGKRARVAIPADALLREDMIA